ncbi:MAG: hypothetical protein ABH821_05545 [archaeon]
MLTEKQIKVVLDTNFLIYVKALKVDVIELIKDKLLEKTSFFVTTGILKEIMKVGGRNRKIALEVIEKNKVKVLKSVISTVDSELVDLSLKNYVIATSDKELRKRIKEAGGLTIFLRQKKFVEMN